MQTWHVNLFIICNKVIIIYIFVFLYKCYFKNLLS